MEVLFILVGVLAAASLFFYFRYRTLEKELKESQKKIEFLKENLSATRAILDENQKKIEEQRSFYLKAEHNLLNSFKALSQDVLKNTNQSFLELANIQFQKFHEGAKSEFSKRHDSIDNLLKPVKETLEKMGESHDQIKKNLAVTSTSIKEQVGSLLQAQGHLQNETANLVKALKKPSVRGRWGEMQLKRVVEMAGMIEHCDFIEQPTVSDGVQKLRPDMVIQLPGGKQIVVDSKTPLMAYLESLEVDNDEVRDKKLQDHARHVKEHIQKLSSKAYWDQFDYTPEFVVLFLPGETFFSAALEQDPRLIEYGVEQKVILATPTTLIALLRSASYGWRQEALAENAQKISDLGKALYERIGILTSHFHEIKRGLDKTVDAYNASLNSFETRILPAARKFDECGITIKSELKLLNQVEIRPKNVSD